MKVTWRVFNQLYVWFLFWYVITRKKYRHYFVFTMYCWLHVDTSIDILKQDIYDPIIIWKLKKSSITTDRLHIPLCINTLNNRNPMNRHIICGHNQRIGNRNILNVFESKDTNKLFKSNTSIRYCHISHVDVHGEGLLSI